MKTIMHGVGVVRARLARHAEGWTVVSFVALFIGLPACSLHRGGLAAPAHEWRASATLRDAAGLSYDVDSDDSLFAEGDPRTLATDDTTHADGSTPEQRILDRWRRYLRHRLESPHGAEFVTRFGTGPWCLAADTVTQTATLASGFPEPDVEDPLIDCSDPGSPTCGNPAGTVPILQVDPPSVAFGPVPVGTAAPEVTLTLSNVGAGRLCLDGDFSILPAAGTLPGEFAGNFIGCRPMWPDELAIGRVVLSAATRPTCTVRVGFRPSNRGARSAALRISSNDPASPSVVALAGEGQPGALTAPSAVCFNVVPDDLGGRSCYGRRVVLHNGGPGTVTITSATVPGADAATWYREQPDITRFPLSVAPGADQDIVVRACEPGIADSVLTVMSNASTPVIDIPLLRPSSGCTP